MKNLQYIRDNSNIEEQKLEAAKKFIVAEKYSDALNIYLDMAKTSCSFRLYYDIGYCYYQLNDLENALVYFNQSVKLQKKRNPSYHYLGNICIAKGQDNLAIQNWELAFAYKPDNEELCLNLATKYFTKKMLFQSIRYYEKYLKISISKHNEAYLQIKDAINDFKSKSRDFYLKSSKAVRDQDMLIAINALISSVYKYPLNFDANYKLGELYNDSLKYELAIPYLKQALCIDNNSIDALKLISSVYLNLKDFNMAYCYLKRLLPLVMHSNREIEKVQNLIKKAEKECAVTPRLLKILLQQAKFYYEDNNYFLALLEYENYLILSNKKSSAIIDIVDELKYILGINSNFIQLYSDNTNKQIQTSDIPVDNKYISQMIKISDKSLQGYENLKSRYIHV